MDELKTIPGAFFSFFFLFLTLSQLTLGWGVGLLGVLLLRFYFRMAPYLHPHQFEIPLVFIVLVFTF
jgi:hypothetical protein